MIFRFLVRTAVIAGVAFGLAACGGVKMPKPDSGQAIEPPHPAAYCTDKTGIYAQTFDLNPQTEAAARAYGWFDVDDSGDPTLEEPVAIQVQDDAGKTVGVFVHENGSVVKYDSAADVLAKYPGLCDLPRRAQRI